MFSTRCRVLLPLQLTSRWFYDSHNQTVSYYRIYVLKKYPVYVSNCSGIQVRSLWLQFLHHIQFLDFNYGIKQLMMMQKLEARTVDLKPTKIGHICGQGKIDGAQNSGLKLIKLQKVQPVLEKKSEHKPI